jgi:dolichol-phosphate mannosyltransferase
MKKRPVYSIVVPMYNEEASIQALYDRLVAVMDSTGEPWEFVMVDDGSADRTADLIKDYAEQDQRVRPVLLARNFGHQIAVTAGLDHAHGNAVVIIDADLQDPPEVILDLIEKWKEGYEVVYAQRAARAGESRFKLWTAGLFYRLINRITTMKIPLDTGDFRLLDRKVVDVLNQMREKHRFLRGMSVWVGFKQAGVKYERAARYAGKTHYTFSKMVKLATTAITGFSFFPLQVATYLGFTAAGVSLIAIPVIVVMRLLGNHEFLGQASTLLATLFLGGVQLIFLGILGEYIGRIYDEVRDRPLYILREGPED